MKLDSLCTYTAENPEFLDTPVHIHVHIHVHVVTMHKYKTIMTVLIVSVYMTNYGFTHVSFVWNVARVKFFSSRAYEFLNQENIC